MFSGMGGSSNVDNEDKPEEPEGEVSEYDKLSKRIEECMSLLEFLGDFKEAFEKHSHDFEEQSAEWEDFMDEMRTDVDAIKTELKDAKDTSKKQDVELMNAIKVLSKTFDKETYDRFTQSEEIQKRFDELQRVKDEVRGEARLHQERADSMMELIDNLKHTLDVQQHEKLTRDEELEKSFAKIEQMRVDFEQGFEFHRKETMELLTAVDILSKTFDNETYERSVQGEEVHRWIEDAKQAVNDVQSECIKQRDATGDLLGAIDQLKVAIDREEKERVDLGMQVDSLKGFKSEIDLVHALQAEERNDMREMVKKLGSSYDVETMERIQQAEKVEDFLADNKKMMETVKRECLNEADAMNELLGAVQSMKNSLETEVKERLSDNDHVIRMLEESSIAMKRGGIAITSSLDRLKGSLSLPRSFSEVEKSVGPTGSTPDTSLGQEALTRYKVDGSKIPQHIARNAGGLAYRKSAKLDDKSAYNVAPWDSYVWGKKEGEFVKVGLRYLPLQLHGETVLFPAGKEDEDLVEEEELKADGQPKRSDEKIFETSKAVRSAAKKIKRIQARNDTVSNDPEPEAETAPDSLSAELQRAVNHLQTQFAHERSERILLFTEVVSLRDQMVPKLQALEKGPSGKLLSGAPIEANSIYERELEDRQAKKNIDDLTNRFRAWEDRLNDVESSFQNRFESLSKDIQSGISPQAFAADNVVATPVKDEEVRRRLADVESQVATMAAKDVLGASFSDMENRVQGHDSKISIIMDQIKSQVSRLDSLTGMKDVEARMNVVNDLETRLKSHESRMSNMTDHIHTQVQEAMRGHQGRFDAIAEQQADMSRRLEKVSSLADIDSRLSAQETKMSGLANEINSQVQASMRTQRQRADELADQQGKAQNNFISQLSESKMFHAEQLSKATSSLRTEIQDLIKSQISAVQAVQALPANNLSSESVDPSVLASIAELKAQVVSLVTSDPVSREEFQEQISGMYQSLSERSGGENGSDAISRKDFESNNRNVWEAIMQLQIKQLEESKQKAREQFENMSGSATAPRASPSAPPRTVVGHVGQVVTQQQQGPPLMLQHPVASAGNLAAAYQMSATSPVSSRAPSRGGSPHPNSTMSPQTSYQPAGVAVATPNGMSLPTATAVPGSPRRMPPRTNSFTDPRGAPLSASFTVSQVQGS